MKQVSFSIKSVITLLLIIFGVQGTLAEEVYLLTSQTINGTVGNYNIPSNHKFLENGGVYVYSFSRHEAVGDSNNDIYFRIGVQGWNNMQPATNGAELIVNGSSYNITDDCYGITNAWKLHLDENYSVYTIIVDLTEGSKNVKVAGISNVYLQTDQTIKGVQGSYSIPSNHQFENSTGTKFQYTFSNKDASGDLYFRIGVNGWTYNMSIQPRVDKDALTINGENYTIGAEDAYYKGDKAWKLTLNNDNYSEYTIEIDLAYSGRYVKVTGNSYYLKHPWDGSNWTWKLLSANGDGTYSVTAAYGGDGCNWNTSASHEGATWVMSPTLIGNPTTGDECVFTLNPSTGEITIKAGAITVYKGSSTAEVASTSDWENIQAAYPNAIALVGANLKNWAEAEGNTNVVVEYNVTANTKYYYCKSLILTDKENFYSPVDFTAVGGNYSRQPNAAIKSTVIYNSFCVPFAIKNTDLSSTAEILTFSRYEEKDLGNGITDRNVYFERKSEINAGTPCVIYDNSTTWNDYTFNNTKIVASPNNDNSMYGTYIKTAEFANQGYYSVNSNNKFGLLTNTLAAFRSCLYLGDGEHMGVDPTSSSAKIIIIDDESETDGIETPQAETEIESIYNINGVKISNLQHGVNILKMKDGSVRKYFNN